MGKRRSNYRGGGNYAARAGAGNGIAKAVAVFIALVILAGIVCAAGYGSRDGSGKWFKNADIATWFNSWGKGNVADGKEDNEPAVIAISDIGEKMYSGVSYILPRALTYTSASESKPEYVENGELTLTAELSNVFIKVEYEWSLSWADDETIDDVPGYYVSLDPVKDGSNTATLKLLEPFDKAILVTCSIKDGGGGNSNAGTCRLDYLKRIGGIDCKFKGNDFGKTVVSSKPVSWWCSRGTVSVDEVLPTSVNIYINGTLRQAIEKNLKFIVQFKPFISDEITVNNENGELYLPDKSYEYSDFIVDFDRFNDSQKQAIYYAYAKATGCTTQDLANTYEAHSQELINGLYFIAEVNFSIIYNGVVVDELVSKAKAGISGYTAYKSIDDINVLLSGGYVL